MTARKKKVHVPPDVGINPWTEDDCDARNTCGEDAESERGSHDGRAERHTQRLCESDDDDEEYHGYDGCCEEHDDYYPPHMVQGQYLPHRIPAAHPHPHPPPPSPTAASDTPRDAAEADLEPQQPSPHGGDSSHDFPHDVRAEHAEWQAILPHRVKEASAAVVAAARNKATGSASAAAPPVNTLGNAATRASAAAVAKEEPEFSVVGYTTEDEDEDEQEQEQEQRAARLREDPVVVDKRNVPAAGYAGQLASQGGRASRERVFEGVRKTGRRILERVDNL